MGYNSVMKLLVVEDEEKLARSLEKGLSAEGYIVDVAGDGDSAETLVSAGSYDLVLLDWMIPGEYDGPALIKLWRERAEAGADFDAHRPRHHRRPRARAGRWCGRLPAQNLSVLTNSWRASGLYCAGQVPKAARCWLSTTSGSTTSPKP